jgi:hypothetical protein
MRGGDARRLETAVDRLAAALFAGAAAFSAAKLLQDLIFQPQLSAVAAGAGAGAYFLCVRFLQRVAPEQVRFAVAQFETVQFDDPAADELVLTSDDRAQPGAETSDELVLDDVLAELSPDSRVVRLFDPAAMPTAGELQQRIERHVGAGHARPAAPDASEALYEALAELRRSLS